MAPERTLQLRGDLTPHPLPATARESEEACHQEQARGGLGDDLDVEGQVVGRAGQVRRTHDDLVDFRTAEDRGLGAAGGGPLPMNTETGNPCAEIKM